MWQRYGVVILKSSLWWAHSKLSWCWTMILARIGNSLQRFSCRVWILLLHVAAYSFTTISIITLIADQMITRHFSKRRGVVTDTPTTPSSLQTRNDSQKSKFEEKILANEIAESPPLSPTRASSSLLSPRDLTRFPIYTSLLRTPRPPPSIEIFAGLRSHFEVNFLEVYVQAKRQLQVRPAPITKQAAARNGLHIWRHGIELISQDEAKIWLCKRCHLARDFSHAGYVATSTAGIVKHLIDKHRISKPEKMTLGVIPIPIGFCVTCGNSKERFNPDSFKQRYVDWVIMHNIAFEAATALDTLNLLRAGARDILSKILPEAASTLSTYVADPMRDRKLKILDSLTSACSKINFSVDGWKAPTKFHYIATVSLYFSVD